MVAESNPLFSQQWHFDLIGDIQTIWQEYTGAGVFVGVYDDGVEADHSDLDGNYNAALHYSGLGSDNGRPNGSADGHGTAVAGIVAAENNDEGGVGVAFNVSLTALDYLNDIYELGRDAELDAQRYMDRFDVTVNSYGWAPTYEDFLNLSDPTSQASEDAETFLHVVSEGRDGLGTIIVKSAGNEFGNAQGEGPISLHTLISVAATDEQGDATDYTNWGTSVLLTAPAAAVTTDLEGSAGDASGDAMFDFGGTSASAPVVAGVVALMLEANPDLGWRDVQNILAISAAHTGSDYGALASGWEESEWYANGATNWNGGGLSVAHSYGYGMVDAFAAVRMAEVWSLLNEDAAVSENEQVVTAAYSGQPRAIADNATTTINIDVTENISIEHIYVAVEFSHTWISDLFVELVAPTGEAFDLFLNELGDISVVDQEWTFGVRTALNMESIGTWQLRVTDSAEEDTGSFSEVQLEFRGAAPTIDTTHHITADFDHYASEEAARRTLSDADGGTDWLNMAALAGDVSASLTVGGSLTVAGENWATLQDASIENLISGDGNDTVTGSQFDNVLHAGRGDDDVRGGQGDDTLHGDQGADLLRGNAGEDALHGGAGNDQLRGQKNADLLDGGDGADNLKGGGGNDTLLGGDGADFLNGGTRRDTIEGGAGNDRLIGRAFDDTLRGGDGHDSLNAGGDNDDVEGGAGSDLIKAGAGNDRFIFNDGFDLDRLVDFTLGEDRLVFSNSVVGGQNANQIAALASQNGNDVDIDLGGGNIVRFLNTTEADLIGLATAIDIV